MSAITIEALRRVPYRILSTVAVATTIAGMGVSCPAATDTFKAANTDHGGVYERAGS